MKIIKTILMLCSSVAAVTGMGTNFGVRNYMQNRLSSWASLASTDHGRPPTSDHQPAINLRTLLNQINNAQKTGNKQMETFHQMLKKRTNTETKSIATTKNEKTSNKNYLYKNYHLIYVFSATN